MSPDLFSFLLLLNINPTRNAPNQNFRTLFKMRNHYCNAYFKSSEVMNIEEIQPLLFISSDLGYKPSTGSNQNRSGL